ncbi:probable disease resistance protein RXW24L [Salvia hispanica]|uniref:probable disease resistance protein RXW24L n=1 Tax=Salvia hispanica TaxID=49212 RepID=UPI002009100E|nr:probable disease resistance protein RXW24L [Salvia hispanica]
MAYEAVESLQQTLLQILVRGNFLISPPVKYDQIVSILHKAVILQLNINHFPDKETIREVANTTADIIQYLFSPQNLTDCGSIDPTVRVSYQLGELAEELDSTVGYLVDYIQQRSDSALVEDPTELIAINTNGLRILAEKFKSTRRELEVEDLSISPPLTNKDVAAGFDDHLTDSAAFASSSRPTSKYDFAEDPSELPSNSPPTTKNDVVVGFDEDIAQMADRITHCPPDSYLEILPIDGMGGIGKSTLAKYVYDHPFITEHFDIRAWVTISQDYSLPSILSQLLASFRGKVDRVGRDSLKGMEEKLEIYKILSGRRYLIVMDDVWSAEALHHIWGLYPNKRNGSRIILTTRLMDVATYAATSRKFI